MFIRYLCKMFFVVLFGLLFLVLIVLYVYGEFDIIFDGFIYVIYLYSGELWIFLDDIVVMFNMIKFFGFFFYVISRGGDFIIFEFLCGKIRYLSLLGLVVVFYFSLYFCLFFLWSGMLIIFFFILKVRVKFVNCFWKLFNGGLWFIFVMGVKVFFFYWMVFVLRKKWICCRSVFFIFL